MWPLLVKQFAGKILGSSLEVVEGSWKPGLVVVQRWPSKAQFQAFFASEAYQPLKTLRRQVVTSALVLFEGLR